MLGHRDLTAEDYAGILKRRCWWIAIPAIVMPLLAIAVTFVISPKYVSQTLVLVDQQKVPDTYVKPVVMEDLNQRLASMKEQILSRSRLQPIIERFDLFSKGNLTIEERLDLTRKAINITPIRSELSRTGGLPGFFISFQADRALVAQQVCAEITSLFVERKPTRQRTVGAGYNRFSEKPTRRCQALPGRAGCQACRFPAEVHRTVARPGRTKPQRSHDPEHAARRRHPSARTDAAGQNVRRCDARATRLGNGRSRSRARFRRKTGRRNFNRWRRPQRT